jgi:acetyl esterase/lipase
LTVTRLLLLIALAHPRVASAQAIAVWPHAAPGSEHWAQRETTTTDARLGAVAFRVVTPTLTAYLPDSADATGTAVIIAPGGSFRGVTIGLEGATVARWFQRRGIAAFVLKYRVLDHHAPGVASLPIDSLARFAIADGVQALRTLRHRAPAWHIDPRRIGVIGFSAGGMVASSMLLQPDPLARPSFAVLVYGAPFGAMPRIPPHLPPTLLVWARDDDIARPAMERFSRALRASGETAQRLVFEHGGHGFGLRHQGTDSDRWIVAVQRWLATL